MQHSNHDIALALHQGDREAFDQLFTRYYKRLVVFGTSLLNDEMQAEEIVGDIYLLLWQRRTMLPAFTNIEAYLFISVRNACFNAIKAMHRTKNFNLDLAQSEEVAEEIYQRSIEEEEIFDATVQLLQAKIATLPPQCAKVCRLYFDEGLSTAEIAERLDIATQTVLNLKNKGLKMLQRAIKVGFGWIFSLMLHITTYT